MSGNTFGTLFTVTTFGESHGPALGCIVDGCPPNIPLTAAERRARPPWLEFDVPPEQQIVRGLLGQ